MWHSKVMETTQTNNEVRPATHRLHGVSPRGDKRQVVFSVSSESVVHVTEFELSPLSGWVRVSTIDRVSAKVARGWYRTFLDRGYKAAA